MQLPVDSQSVRMWLLSSLQEPSDSALSQGSLKEIVDTLREIEERIVRAALEKSLSESRSFVRCRVASVAIQFNLEMALDLLDIIRNDPSSGVRTHVVVRLSETGSHFVEKWLQDVLLHDVDGTVRLEAAWGLGCVGSLASIEVLSEVSALDYGTDYEGRPIREIAGESIAQIQERIRNDNGQVQ